MHDTDPRTARSPADAPCDGRDVLVQLRYYPHHRYIGCWQGGQRGWVVRNFGRSPVVAWWYLPPSVGAEQ